MTDRMGGLILKKYLIISLLGVMIFSLAACGPARPEADSTVNDPAAAEESAEEPAEEISGDPVEEQVPEQYIEPQGDFPVDLIDRWGEPIELGLIINIKEDGTLSAYHLNENDPDGELIYYMDGSWHVEGQELCINLDGQDLYYSYDESSGMLVNRDGTKFFVRTDKGIIPE